jgi:hypothetical protein
MRSKFALLAILALAFAVAGCGDSKHDSGENTPAASPPLTKSELIAQADAICKSSEAKINAIESPDTIEALSDALDKQMAIIEPAVAKLGALTPPEELSADYKAWIAAMNDRKELLEKMQKAAASGATDAVTKVVNEGEAGNKELETLSKKIGFKECQAN